MSWNEVDVAEERIRFAVMAERGEEALTVLCREFGISRATGYKWWKRYRQQGVAGLAERSRRPHHSPQRTAGPIERQVVELRQRRPDWGARKLRVKLAEQGVELPAITVHRILLRHGLVAEEDRVRPALQRFERERPNQLWQMDFKGVPASWETAGLLPLSILDDHSRYLLGLRAQQQTAAQGVRETLEEVFGNCGLPEQMLMDHGTPWWNNQGAGWTKLSVWLMQQGVELRFSGLRHPQTQGKVERLHGSLQRALRRRGRPQRRQDWQGWLDAFRDEYNHERPHEALGMATPASRWRASERRYDPQPKRWEYPEGSWVRRVGVNGGLWLGGKRWEISRALAHQYVALEQVGQRILVRYCRTTVRELDLAHGRSCPVPVNPYDFVWPAGSSPAEPG
jgi:transposase InsO family protein